MDFGSVSKPEITVAPVVVRPDNDSKMASVMDNSTDEERMNGRLPAVPSTAQNSVTMRNPSRVPSSVRARNVSSHMKKPTVNTVKNDSIKGVIIPSP